MNKLPLIGILATLIVVPFTTTAKSLTPQEALSYASKTLTKVSAKADNEYQLSYTQKGNEETTNTVYVFSRGSDNGFIVLAADDCIGDILLGYADSGVFDAANIPPAMQDWLKMWSKTVENSVQDGRKLLIAKTVRQSISPIVKTEWGQSSPYNLDCPIVNGQQSVTGCVATAMAQVIKVHNWPVTGTGSNSYSWTYNGKQYSTSLDFSSITFDWDNMTDTYTQSSSTVSQNAVAQLMYACGVACNMQYSPNESGAGLFNAAIGMKEYLNFDPSLTYFQRSWFTLSQWEELIYDQLSVGQPVLFGGVDIANEGHSFVLDGYNEDGYFHVNWGWQGLSNGYFIITDLNPDSQGIGGGSQESGFNFGQELVVNIKRPVDGSSTVPVMAVNNNITTDSKTYDRNGSTMVKFDGGYYSYSTGECEFMLGVHIKGNNIDEYISWDYGNQKLPSLAGYESLPIRASKFPVGEYDVIPSFKALGKNWQEMYYNVEECGPLNFTVTENSITISDPFDNGQAKAELTSSKPANSDDGDNYYLGHTYNFTYDITSDGKWSGTTQVILIKGNSYYCSSNTVDVDLTTASSKTFDYTMVIPSGLSAGTYDLALSYTTSGGVQLMSDRTSIQVSQVELSGTGQLNDVVFVGSPSNGVNQSSPAILYNDDPEIQLTFQCTQAPWKENIWIYFANTSLAVIGQTDVQYVSVDNVGENITLSFKGPWDNLSLNTTYAIAVYGENESQMSRVYYFQIQEKKVEKQDQTITWDQEIGEVTEDATIELNAIASSGLDIIYKVIKGQDIATLNGNVVTMHGIGEVEIQATQPGNDTYNAATPVSKTFSAIAGIAVMQADNFAVKVVNNVVIVNGLTAGQYIKIYALHGRQVYSGNENCITLQPNNNYIVVTPAGSYKIHTN